MHTLLINLDEIFGEPALGQQTATQPAPAELANEPAIVSFEGHPVVSRNGEAVRWGRGTTIRLCGSGFPPRPTPTVPAAIVADPIVLCPRCASKPVLAEMRELTGGLCYPCWEGSRK
jgi:hypothetical protein